MLEVCLRKYGLSDPWDVVDLFERSIADYAGSKYAVTVDSCTNAMFLCLKYLKFEDEITIPARTYVSVPCTVIHAGCQVKFEDVEWEGAYQLKPTPVYDGAVHMCRDMYKSDTFHCLSFHRKKHIPIGKGGMILTDDKEAYEWFKVARYEGRHMDRFYKDDEFDVIGWNMYMTPEQASKGLLLFHEKIKDKNPDVETSGNYNDLSRFPIYEKANR